MSFNNCSLNCSCTKLYYKLLSNRHTRQSSLQKTDGRHAMREKQRSLQMCNRSTENLVDFMKVGTLLDRRTKHTRPKNYQLVQVWWNRVEQCFASHIVYSCQQYCSPLSHLIAGWFRLSNIVQYCWQLGSMLPTCAQHSWTLFYQPRESW